MIFCYSFPLGIINCEERLYSLVLCKYYKIEKKNLDSRERCLGEWRGNINKVLKTDKFKDLTFEEDWEVNLSIEIRKC